MDRHSKAELLRAYRKRYRRAPKREKNRILDQIVEITGYHRKHLIRALNHPPRVPKRDRRPRTSRYTPILEPLRFIWAAANFLCGKRLAPFLPDLLSALKRHREIQLTHEQERLLRSVSPATLDRLLAPARRGLKPKGRSTTKPSTHLRHQIPLRTFADWNDEGPGFLEVDLVAHCGDSLRGEYINTLTMTDVATGWTVCTAFIGRSERFCSQAIEAARTTLPFPLLGIHSDNDSIFINAHLTRYCQRLHLTFTRSRPYKRNDQCHVEQKNWDVVRKTVGYARFDTPLHLETLQRIWGLLSLYQNYFQPSRKLIAKHRVGAKISKTYDTAQTPCQRLLARPDTPPAANKRLAATYRGLNPAALLRSITQLIDQLYAPALR